MRNDLDLLKTEKIRDQTSPENNGISSKEFELLSEKFDKISKILVNFKFKMFLIKQYKKYSKSGKNNKKKSDNAQKESSAQKFLHI